MNGQEAQSGLQGLRTKGLLVGVLGAAAAIFGLITDSQQFYHSYITAFLYWLAVSLGCLGWVMIYHLTEGAWGLPSRRVWEAGARTLPLMALLFLPILFGMEALFPWTRPEAADDAIIHAKAHYLNVPFFIARAAVLFAIWFAFASLLTNWSKRQDEEGFEPTASWMRKLSGIGLLFMALTVTFASVDWAMSLDPHWFSTIFGFLFAASDLLAAMAVTILAVRMLSKYEPLNKIVTANTYHDLGNLLMAFVMLWAYLSFSQFLIIWSGNLQEEAPWYVDRMGDGWIIVSVALILFHFALPFVILLTRRTKRAPAALTKVAVWVLAVRFVDLYWITQPSLTHGEFHGSWMDLALLAGIGGLWTAFFAMQLQSRPLVAQNDRNLAKALEGAGGLH